MDRELAHLHYLMLAMADLVDRQIKDALQAFVTQDLTLASSVMTRDREVDDFEIQADSEILHLLTRNSPLASDLREVIMYAKSVSELEKLGNEAVAIAGVPTEILEERDHPLSDPWKDVILQLGDATLARYGAALRIFSVMNLDGALDFIKGRQAMDDYFQSALRELTALIRNEVNDVSLAMGLMLVAKSLERITRHALNLTQYSLSEMKGVDYRRLPT
jgi:phosphate transport system protein